jgi:hypothetical protein
MEEKRKGSHNKKEEQKQGREKDEKEWGRK